MPYEYAQKRQGRDFPIHNHLRTVEMSVEGNYNNIDGIIGNNDPKDGTEKRKPLLERLEQCKEKAKRNAARDDGNKPHERGL
ncbi:MAG: DUF4316 domain-containing protein [Defluviitaleaceae bacterium]|nr:DUF4316 domain-containing protein [Defluviitaleaceae bacterium]